MFTTTLTSNPPPLGSQYRIEGAWIPLYTHYSLNENRYPHFRTYQPSIYSLLWCITLNQFATISKHPIHPYSFLDALWIGKPSRIVTFQNRYPCFHPYISENRLFWLKISDLSLQIWSLTLFNFIQLIVRTKISVNESNWTIWWWVITFFMNPLKSLFSALDIDVSVKIIHMSLNYHPLSISTIISKVFTVFVCWFNFKVFTVFVFWFNL